ncbi:hypothetical protein DFI_19730 (plasmid) [Deinococcus ficus]|uniref:Uncharacterized protein n=1 Tax=Deinococcus ficus TaxID=317577 RepID=A0A221T3I7_9DEIO|nr:hypothetical protein DFI_19730 [Deinococcus ficus]
MGAAFVPDAGAVRGTARPPMAPPLTAAGRAAGVDTTGLGAAGFGVLGVEPVERGVDERLTLVELLRLDVLAELELVLRRLASALPSRRRAVQTVTVRRVRVMLVL